MRKFSDKTQRTIRLLLEPQDVNKLIYERLVKAGYNFDEKEVELKYDFVEEGSPAYKTGKIKCSITITKDLSDA